MPSLDSCLPSLRDGVAAGGSPDDATNHGRNSVGVAAEPNGCAERLGKWRCRRADERDRGDHRRQDEPVTCGDEEAPRGTQGTCCIRARALPEQVHRRRTPPDGRFLAADERPRAIGSQTNVKRAPTSQPGLYRIHECVFGVLAFESEPVDPRL